MGSQQRAVWGEDPVEPSEKHFWLSGVATREWPWTDGAQEDRPLTEEGREQAWPGEEEGEWRE